MNLSLKNLSNGFGDGCVSLKSTKLLGVTDHVPVKGNHLTVVFNGEQIQDLDLSKTGLKDRPAKGYIGFQDEAKRIWYRNVRIKELQQGKGLKNVEGTQNPIAP